VILEFEMYRWDKVKGPLPAHPGEYTPLWNVVELGWAGATTTVRCAAMRYIDTCDTGKCELTIPLMTDADGTEKRIVYEQEEPLKPPKGLRVLVVVHPEDTAAAATAIRKMRRSKLTLQTSKHVLASGAERTTENAHASGGHYASLGASVGWQMPPAYVRSRYRPYAECGMCAAYLAAVDGIRERHPALAPNSIFSTFYPLAIKVDKVDREIADQGKIAAALANTAMDTLERESVLLPRGDGRDWEKQCRWVTQQHKMAYVRYQHAAIPDTDAEEQDARAATP
jgi:hypothetical protein